MDLLILIVVVSYAMYFSLTKLREKDCRIKQLKTAGILCDSKPMKPHERKALWINKGGEEKNLECQ